MKHIGKVFSSITIVALLTTPLASSKHIQAQQTDNQNTATSDKPVNRVILPNNNRHQISNTTQGHYQAIAFAKIGDSAIASGVVIGPNTLLTNKHVVDGTNGNPRNLSFALQHQTKIITPKASLLLQIILYPLMAMILP